MLEYIGGGTAEAAAAEADADCVDIAEVCLFVSMWTSERTKDDLKSDASRFLAASTPPPTAVASPSPSAKAIKMLVLVTNLASTEKSANVCGVVKTNPAPTSNKGLGFTVVVEDSCFWVED